AEQDPEKFRREHGAEAERLQAATGQAPLLVTNHDKAEAAANLQIIENRITTEAEFAPKMLELSHQQYDARRSTRDWQGYVETAYVCGGLGMLLVILAALAVAAYPYLVVAEKTNPGTILGVFASGGIIAAVLVFFVGLVIVMNRGTEA